jgi:hypothetical protein
MIINQGYSSIAQTLSAAAAPSAAYADSNPTSAHVGGFGFEKPNTGKANDWLTPLGLLQRLGTFDLDPCGCSGMPWRTATTTYFLPEHDGLTKPWDGRVWCNLPYGRTSAIGRGRWPLTVTALCSYSYAATPLHGNTTYFHSLMLACFLKGAFISIGYQVNVARAELRPAFCRNLSEMAI